MSKTINLNENLPLGSSNSKNFKFTARKIHRLKEEQVFRKLNEWWSKNRNKGSELKRTDGWTMTAAHILKTEGK